MHFILLVFTLVFSFKVVCLSHQPEKYIINLDLPAHQRYSQIAIIKKQSIVSFIKHLQENSLYSKAFKIAQLMTPLLKKYLQKQFYLQCLSVSKVVDLPVSRIIVLNYMYELGAFHKFCTSIPAQYYEKNTLTGQIHKRFILARNLDYDFQEDLANNSVHFFYQKNSQTLFQTFGHAGFIGTHTALRKLKNMKSQIEEQEISYAITLNQRIQGGFHKTLLKMITQRCETAPYLIMKTLKTTENVSQVLTKLTERQLCAPVYYNIATSGKNYIIERSRKAAQKYPQKLNQNTVYQNNFFFVHTNTDRNKSDPDGRRVIAQQKITKLYQQNSYLSDTDFFKVLTQSPNFNNLTLITMSLKSNGQTRAQIWK